MELISFGGLENQENPRHLSCDRRPGCWKARSRAAFPGAEYEGGLRLPGGPQHPGGAAHWLAARRGGGPGQAAGGRPAMVLLFPDKQEHSLRPIAIQLGQTPGLKEEHLN